MPRLTLLEMIVLTSLASTFAGAIAGILSGYMVAHTIHGSNRKQLELQHKVASARLVVELRSSWRDDAKFQDMLKDVGNETLEDILGGTKLDFHLNKLEDVAMLWADGMLHDDHVRPTFGAALRPLREKGMTMDDHRFPCLRKLLKKSEEWDTGQS